MCGGGFPGRTPSEVVFLFGGWSGKEPSELIQILNPITYQWSVTSLSLPEMRIYYAAAEVDGIIYIIGGFDNNSRYCSCTVHLTCSLNMKPVAGFHGFFLHDYLAKILKQTLLKSSKDLVMLRIIPR